MRWPLVRRAALDEANGMAATRGVELIHANAATARYVEALEHRDQIISRLEAKHERDMVGERARYAELLARVQVLAPIATDPASPRAPAEPDPVSKVIREQSEGNIPLANHLRRYARTLKQDGFTADQIVGKLVAWTSTEADEVAS